MPMISDCYVVLLSLLMLPSLFATALLQGEVHSQAATSRASFVKTISACLISPSIFVNGNVVRAAASEEKFPYSDEELRNIVKADLLDRQFLVTGDLTRDIYRSTATFTDEIDTYKMDQWMKGTQKLFVGEKSNVRLVGDVEVAPDKVVFRFDEDLMFRIPFNPVVYLSGKVVLDRDSTGYITSYREFWDQDVGTVLKSAKF